MKFLALVTSFILNACTTIHPTSVAEFDSVTVKVLSDSGGGGSGVVFKSTDKGSVILTNAHVCGAIATGGQIAYYDFYTIRRFKISKRHDICYVYIKENLYVNTTLAKKAPPRHSEIFISGHPSLYPHVLSQGYVSGTDVYDIAESKRACDFLEEQMDPVTCIFEGRTNTIKREATLMSALISPGSSGSGVFNNRGELVGLAFAAQGEIGYALVVPYKYLYTFVTTEAKSLQWETPGPEHKKTKYYNPGMEDLNNWKKLFDLIDKRK